VTGSGTRRPSDGDLVSMQALYKGVTFPNIYSDNVSFTIPGPPPVNFDGSGGTTTARPTTSASITTQTGIAASTTISSYPGSQPSMQCHLGSKLRRRKSV